MAALYIEEFAATGRPSVEDGFLAAALASSLNPSTSQPVLAISGSPVQSNLFGFNTILIRVNCDSICSIKIGAPGTTVASTGNMRLAANQTEYFAVRQGDVLSVVANV